MPDLTDGGQTSEVSSDQHFGGVSRLYGDAAVRRLQTSFVAVVGVGGVGSWACEALARSGVGRLLLIDPDSIAYSNLNRQLPALQSTVGASKVATISARIADIRSACHVDVIEDALTSENIAQMIPANIDVVIDAIDAPRVKAALIAWCRDRQIAVIVCGAAGGRDDPLALHACDLALTTGDALLSKTRARLRREHGFTRTPDKKFKVLAVCSTQTPIDSVNSETINSKTINQQISDNAAAQGAPLNCSGYGSIVTVTAAMGFAAASKAIQSLINHTK